MSLPINEREEYPVSSRGTEEQPQNVVVKGSLWTLQRSYSSFIIQEYNGYTAAISSLNAANYLLTPALKSDLTLDTDRFWVWVISYAGILSLYEIEPYPTAVPVITYSKLGLASNVVSVSTHIRDSEAILLLILNTSQELNSYRYLDIRASDPPVVTPLNWAVSHLQSISNFTTPDKTELSVTYLDVASPPNVYVESYSVPTPVGLAASQVGPTASVFVSWGASSGADEYVLERSTDALFTIVTVVYTGPLITYTDTVPVSDLYYYRVRARISGLLLESTWSAGVSVNVVIVIFTVAFTGVPLTGQSDLSVAFTDQSTPQPSITSRLWDFGDGNTSTSQNPTHNYTVAGTYSVTLTVSDGTSSSLLTKNDYITVNPTASFSAGPITGNAPLQVTFTDTSLGVPTAWLWDFGDGNTSTVQSPMHTYSTAGLYTVQLTVSRGVLSDSTTLADLISVNIVADFSSTPNSGNAPLQVTFTDTSLGVPTAWLWDFGDGSTSTVQSPTHIYTSAGTFTTTLTASRGSFSDTVIKTNLITTTAGANFTSDIREGDAPLVVHFLDTSLGEPTQWYWDFGDLGTSTEQHPTHIYYHPGKYNVRLTIFRGVSSSTKIVREYIYVYPKDIGIATTDEAPPLDRVRERTAYAIGHANYAFIKTGVHVSLTRHPNQ
jgi:PKD repeat protein